MSVKIRLTRMGKKKQPTYRLVVVDGRKPRDGKYIEQIGRYDPRQEPSLIEVDNDKALDWLHKGAQPTETAQKLLQISGAWTRFRIAKGDIHTIEETAPPAPAAAKTPEPVIHVVEDNVDAPAEMVPEVHVVEDSVEAPAEIVPEIHVVDDGLGDEVEAEVAAEEAAESTDAGDMTEDAEAAKEADTEENA